jgi:hypothetical protein
MAASLPKIGEVGGELLPRVRQLALKANLSISPVMRTALEDRVTEQEPRAIRASLSRRGNLSGRGGRVEALLSSHP